MLRHVFLLAPVLLLTACAGTTGSSASCAFAVEYEGRIYTGEQRIDPDLVGASLGVHQMPACNDTGGSEPAPGDPSPGDVEIFRVEGFDPRHVVYAQIVGADAEPEGRRLSVGKDEMPADVWSSLQADTGV
ncbi:DUF6281 family protein [Kineosporia succinea]|uniref:Secreted protein n=1 Tax=Kineosporia succinea TaxID=84632 RepID=A0ABT9PE94_9ACTN|nr:DUF6281 family protein [Kineosporia succinea]MDP9831043.1 hypothetical protein [Kineosporia succinea]